VAAVVGPPTGCYECRGPVRSQDDVFLAGHGVFTARQHEAEGASIPGWFMVEHWLPSLVWAVESRQPCHPGGPAYGNDLLGRRGCRGGDFSDFDSF
jgi:hypothetical protein